MSARFVFVTLLIAGIYLTTRGTMILYTKAPETKESKERELDMILEREILKDKANIQRIDNDELLDFQFKQKPSEIYAHMFETNPFRLGI